MRLLICLSQVYRLGGAERLGVELALASAERNVPADVVALYDDDDGVTEQVAEQLERRGVPKVHRLGLRPKASLVQVVAAANRMRRVIQSGRYDAVEVSLVAPALLALIATRGLNVTVLVGIHQVFQWPRDASLNGVLLALAAHVWPEVRFYGVSHYVAQSWARFSRTRSERTVVVYNALPEAAFHVQPERAEVRSELGLPADARLALYVGRVAAYKGIQSMVEALGPICEANRLYLLCAGAFDGHVPGTTAMMSHIGALLDQVSWGSRVKFIGFRSDVGRLMASADLLVHPTETEGFGLALVEALAAGLSVVATAVEAIPEVLAGSGAILVPPGNVDAMRAGVAEVLTRGVAATNDARQRGLRRAAQFTTQRRVSEILHVLEAGLLAGS